MRLNHRSGWLLVMGFVVVLARPQSAMAANPPVSLVALSIAGQGDYGTIKGRLVWGGDGVPARKNLVEPGKALKDPEVCAKDQPIASRELVVDPKTKGVAFGFAYLVRPQGANPDAVKAILSKQPSVEMDQKNCEFIPYALAMHQDQTLVIKSSDPVNHNVRYAAFTNAPFNQILAPNGHIDVKLVAERRPIVVACDIHNWMKAYIMVFDHPFYAVTAADGSFEIKGVPAGEQHLVVWQETVGYVNPEKAKGMTLTVHPGETSSVGPVTLKPR